MRDIIVKRGGMLTRMEIHSTKRSFSGDAKMLQPKRRKNSLPVLPNLLLYGEHDTSHIIEDFKYDATE
jgi:hypothetical protein